MNLDNWSHKDVWTRHGTGFAVEISRHEVVEISRHEVGVDPLVGTGPHRWAIYAYVYPKHPHFMEFDGTDKMWQPAARAFPLHAGPSYLRTHRYADGGAITSYQVGADYNHLHDEHFTFEAEMPDEVLSDAERLFAWLEERGADKPVEQVGGAA